MSVAYVYSHESSQPHSDAVWSVAWTGNDSILSASADGVLAISSSSSGDRLHSLPAHPVGITCVTTSTDGSLALFNTLDGTVGLVNVDIESHQLSIARTFRSPSDRPWVTSLAPDGCTYASTGKSGGAFIHSANPDSSFGDSRLKMLADGPSSFGVCAAYSPDGVKLAVGTRSGAVNVFDVHTGSLAATLSSHAKAVRTIAWAPDSHLLISGSEDHRIGVHDVRHAHNGRGAGTVGSLPGHNGWILSTDISPDGRYLLSGSSDKSVRIWDLAARTAVGAVQDALGEVWSVRWRPGSGAGAFATGGEDGVVRWYRGAGLD